MSAEPRLLLVALLVVLGACRDGAAPATPASEVDVAPGKPGVVLPTADVVPSGPLTGWLRVEGPRIMTPEGKPFRGRGANLNDTRSCDSCSWEKPHVEEVLRRIDALVDDWHATFIRLLLESYPDPGPGPGRVHYKTVLEDEGYFRDLMRIIGHIGKKRGVYVLVSLWHDPTFSPLGWPTERTRTEWKKIARALRDMPFVMFGLVNEPQKNQNGQLDGEVWTAMNETVAAIRSVEEAGKNHIVTVQGTREWGRVLEYYVAHPITAGGGKNVAYETHVYDRPGRFDELVTKPSRTLPVIIGELGVINDKNAVMLPEDTVALMDLAEKLDVPWMAYTFHTNCPPNLLVDHAGTCGVGASLEPSAWGRIVKERLARPW
ncbi:MAG TPA: cellulase family glycosylhydrolase [Labilithrix sp.]|nr:cellulase family glycosylhydrolase [Labilithrix sp.]